MMGKSISDNAKDLPLGECPYCGGKVTITFKQRMAFSLLFSRSEGFYIPYGGLKCENGCDLEHFYVPHEGDDSLTTYDALIAYSADWKNAYNALKHVKPCGKCGGRAKWLVEPDSACVGCVQCGIKACENHRYYQLARLALKWNKSQSEWEKAKKIESELNDRIGISSD